jgi:hypothetical protein
MADPVSALCRQVNWARHADPDRVRRWIELIALFVPPGRNVTEVLSSSDLISLWQRSGIIGGDQCDRNAEHRPFN